MSPFHAIIDMRRNDTSLGADFVLDAEAAVVGAAGLQRDHHYQEW